MGQSNQWRVRLAPYLEHGAKAGARRLAKRTLAPWASWGSLLFLETPLEEPPAAPAMEGLCVREVAGSDLPTIATVFGRDVQALAGRLARGDRAFGLFDPARGELPLHLRWLTGAPTPIPEAGLWLCPGPGQVYLYDVITHPLHRGHRRMAGLRSTLDRLLLEQGFRTKLGYVRGDNRSMLRAIEHASVRVRRLFTVHYLARPGQPPWIAGRYAPPVYGAPPPCDGRPPVTRSAASAAAGSARLRRAG